MEKIASFQIDHNTHKPGLYLSRKDKNVYTYDMRFKRPNKGDYISLPALHSIEHMFATAVRNGHSKDKVVYFGPMGCRTGFYLLLFDTDIDNARKIVIDAIKACLTMDFVPGRKKIECGNYRCHDIDAAKTELEIYLDCLLNVDSDKQTF